MKKILIDKDGRILNKGRVVTGNCLGLLSFCVELEKGFTLGSFFAMADRHREFLPLSDLFSTFLSMVEKMGGKTTKTCEINGLIFYKTIAMKGFPGKPAVQIYNSLKGRVPENLPGTYGTKPLKFFQMESLMEHDLHLGELKHIIFGDVQDMFSYETFYSLYELIEGITWELSFNFNPLQCSIRR